MRQNRRSGARFGVIGRVALFCGLLGLAPPSDPESARPRPVPHGAPRPRALSPQPAPAAPPVDLASPGHPGYMADQRGCYVFSANPAADKAAEWSGACREGYASGPGTLRFRRDGALVATTAGSMQLGHMEGQAQITWVNGNRYIGSLVHDYLEGQGTFLWQDGGRYDGEFRAGFKKGYGRFLGANGFRYVGTWAANLPNGTGTATSPGNQSYSGNWRNGCFHDGTRWAYILTSVAKCREADPGFPGQ